MTQETRDVAIIGGGLVGTTLALLLGEAGWRVDLFDAGPRPDGMAPAGDGPPALRVSALTAATERLLTSLGVWPWLAARRVAPYRGMAVWDAEGSGEIGFDAEDVGVASLGTIVENDLLLAGLRQRLGDLPSVTCHFEARLSGYRREAGVSTLLFEDGSRWRTPLVVGADGGRSVLRGLAGIAVSERDTGQVALVTSVRTEWGHGGIARQAFLPTGPLAFLPLNVPLSPGGEPALAGQSNDHHCSIVWSTTPSEAKRLTRLADNDAGREALARELEAGIGERLGQVRVIDAAPHFPIVQRHAQRYVDDGLALVGDAAHSLHPLAGQGVNLGMMDVAVLAEEWVRARQRGADPADARILARYARRRRGDNAVMLGAMQGFQRLFGSAQPALRLARNWGLGGVDRLMPVKRLMIRQALGEAGDLAERCR
ncbi:UbiH/UbiF/VisC/COQ6 family ubiquinone biosynthesis hydroxylase [Salinicola aestuarinus]|uniref:UbiH/UbiF/VisC/COQ6 family ubiquinone biosynthesis hydroxylase n=1 Tax=Salinicola aestuarinus TaxID=1949082 RepID=UPI000DA17A50|nr:UbiH/UbiF/VisC/COQ6 family ubiquinone biosynthesis hydroxylase [Salinicola aestuarinus]